ncbi:hypothetical protein D3C86_764720 [compost metagenome]
MSSSVISSISSIGKLASTTTTAVISFDMEAMGRTTFSFLANRTVDVSRSCTYAVLERSAAASARTDEAAGGMAADAANAARCPRPGLLGLPFLPAAAPFLGGVPLAATCLPPLGGAFLAVDEDLGGAFLALGAALAAACLPDELLPDAAFGAGAFLACCALQAADLALVLQGSEFFAASAAGGRSAHIASAMGATAFAIARFQENAMVEQAYQSVKKCFASRRIVGSGKVQMN